MTKKELIDFIEKAGNVMDFSRSYYNHRPKAIAERDYQSALRYLEYYGKKVEENKENNNR